MKYVTSWLIELAFFITSSSAGMFTSSSSTG